MCRICAPGRSGGFTLIELLIVIVVIGLLAGMLLPALSQAIVSAKVARAKVELGQIGTCLHFYHNDYGVFPPAVTFCESMTEKLEDYNELSGELYDGNYLSRKIPDVFNKGHSYKYKAPGLGWANGALSVLGIWVPNGFPGGSGYGGRSYFRQDESPVKWALWSVGPGGAKTVFESDRQNYPVRPDKWYPRDRKGIIVRLYTGEDWINSN